jgi:hypothetical protein
MRRASRLLTLAALAAAATSCGDAVRSGRSPMYLVINTLQAAPGNKPAQLGGNLLSDVVTNVLTPAPCSPATPCPTVFNDLGQATLAIAPKDPLSPATPSSTNAVTINRIHVEYVRADGRNTPGVDVPFAFDGAATGTILPGATLTLGFEIVRHVAKEESPLVQLQASAAIITTIARVTFYGHDQAGNEVTVTGSIQIDFGNFGD